MQECILYVDHLAQAAVGDYKAAKFYCSILGDLVPCGAVGEAEVATELFAGRWGTTETVTAPNGFETAIMGYPSAK